MKLRCFGEEALDELNIAGATSERFSLLTPQNASGNYVKVIQRVPVKMVSDPGRNTQILRLGMSVEPTVITNRGSLCSGY